MSMLTVTAAAASFRLTTVDAVKDELGITGSADDDWLLRKINAASEDIAGYCNRVFAQETVIETIRVFSAVTLPGHSPASMLLSRFPVVSIASITECGTALTASQYEGDAADGFVAKAGMVWRLDDGGERTDWAVGKTVVAYTAGYVLPGELGRTLPHVVEEAAIELVKLAWFARKRDPMLKETEVAGVGRETYWVGAVGDQSPGIPDDIARKLEKYIVPSVG